MAVLPLIMSASGLVPQTPIALRNQLVTTVAATNVDYTANLPGTLIEDVASTDTYALLQCDSALVELVNSVSPYGANAFILNELGQVYGVQLGQPTNTSVYVVFTGPPGYVVVAGFTVSDGTYQYTVTDGGIVGAGSITLPLQAVATQTGSWAVPAGSVTQIVTSVPSGFTVTVSNPQVGTPGTAAETETSYRSRVLQAGLAASQGMPRYFKTLLSNVPGVQSRLVSARAANGGWEMLVGGSADPYQIAYAVFRSLFDVSTLVGSVLAVSGITNASPGVVTTALNHGYATGQVVVIRGATGISGINGVNLTITVIDQKTFSIGVNTTSSGAYTGNGVLTPNFRNIIANVNDYPDTYAIPFVNAPQQSVAIAVTWNTTSSNVIPPANVAQLAIPALVDYVNNVAVGQPMNLFELQTAFQVAITPLLAPAFLTRMVFAVSINGVGVSPSAGTGVIAGDPESYFYTTNALVTVVQG